MRLQGCSLIWFLNLVLMRRSTNPHHAVQPDDALLNKTDIVGKKFTIEIITRGTMRLIDAREFVNEERDFFLDYRDEFTTPYTIISHRWEDEEVSLQDVIQLHTSPSLKGRKGYQKVLNACLRTLADCFRYVWIDTCCIDKTSSAELQEAINSMFHWYAEAAVCYVYLCDVPGDCPQLTDELLSRDDHRDFIFTDSVWFTRAWTLQELIAPRHLAFHSANWNRICTLRDVVETISERTSIDVRVLTHDVPILNFPVAVRMSWAAYREASRTEDIAYSLLGIFDVNMPMLYGERDKAFRRLQENIIRTHTDQSIFCWQYASSVLPARETSPPLLASCPEDFEYTENTRLWRQSRPFELTNAGLRLQTNLIYLHDDHYAAVMNARSDRDSVTDMVIPEQYVYALRLLKDPSHHETGITDTYLPADTTACAKCSSGARVDHDTRLYRLDRGRRLLHVDRAWAEKSECESFIISYRNQKEPSETTRHLKDTVAILSGSWLNLEVETAVPSHLWVSLDPKQTSPLSLRRGLKMCIPNEFFALSDRVINPDHIELGKDLISGSIQLIRPGHERLYIVVNILRHFNDVATFDVGLVKHETELPGPTNTLEGLAMKQELRFGNVTYKISQVLSSSSGNTVIFILNEKEDAL